jgi:hypothetical protein
MEEAQKWKRIYTLVIILNAIYILIFYFIMISNA